MKCLAWMILRVTFLPFTHTIYTLITHKSIGGHLERKTLDRFSTTQHTHLLERESYSSLVRNHCSLVSFALPLPYIKRKFVPNTIHTYSECSECFRTWDVLGICQKKPMRLSGCNWVYCGIRES